MIVHLDDEIVGAAALCVLHAGSELHEEVYAAFLDRQRAVRTSRWKLIRTPAEKRVQLFDVRSDPWEMRDLSADPRHRETVAMMDGRLRRLMRELSDPLDPETVLGFPPRAW